MTSSEVERLETSLVDLSPKESAAIRFAEKEMEGR
jgi:hypothetical protein